VPFKEKALLKNKQNNAINQHSNNQMGAATNQQTQKNHLQPNTSATTIHFLDNYCGPRISIKTNKIHNNIIIYFNHLTSVGKSSILSSSLVFHTSSLFLSWLKICIFSIKCDFQISSLPNIITTILPIITCISFFQIILLPQ